MCSDSSSLGLSFSSSKSEDDDYTEEADSVYNIPQQEAKQTKMLQNENQLDSGDRVEVYYHELGWMRGTIKRKSKDVWWIKFDNGNDIDQPFSPWDGQKRQILTVSYPSNSPSLLNVSIAFIVNSKFCFTGAFFEFCL